MLKNSGGELEGVDEDSLRDGTGVVGAVTIANGMWVKVSAMPLRGTPSCVRCCGKLK